MYAVFHEGSRMLVTPIYNIERIKEESSVLGWIDMSRLPLSTSVIELEWERYLEWVFYFSAHCRVEPEPRSKEPAIQGYCGVFPQGLPRLKELFPNLSVRGDISIEGVKASPPVQLPPEVWNNKPFNAVTAWEATRIASGG
jgi:hypothetical protein